jgi:hypothetical protein
MIYFPTVSRESDRKLGVVGERKLTLGSLGAEIEFFWGFGRKESRQIWEW